MLLSRRAAIGLGLPVAFVLLGYVLYPSLATFALGLSEEGLRAFFRGWDSPGGRALRNSVGVSLGTVAGAALVGTGLAWALWRYRLPGAGAARALAALPLALPPLVGVFAFLLLYGETGVLPRLVRDLAGLDAVPFALRGRGAVTLVHVYSFYVYVYLFAAAALRDLDADLLDAAADLGASGWRTFRDVVLPALAPALAGSLLLVFMLSMASFTAPLLFAGGDPFLTTLVYEAKLNDEMALSATAATVLTVVCLLVLVVLEARRTPLIRRPAKGAARPARPIERGPARAAWGALVAVALLLVALPVLTVLLLSFADATTWTTQLLPERYSLEHYRRLFSEPQVFAPIRNSLVMAALATAANLVFGVAVALVVVKGALPGRRVLLGLAMLPFAVPGTVIALNLIVVFNQPSALAGGAVLVGSFWLLPLAYFIRNVPLVVRAATAALEGFDDRLAEASADLGASRWTTFRRVVLPGIWPAVMAGTLLSWVAALGEFVASILLYVFSNRPIAIEIFSQLRLQDLGLASAYAVLLMALVALSTWLFRRFGAG